jgi:hypothetical protein
VRYVAMPLWSTHKQETLCFLILPGEVKT